MFCDAFRFNSMMETYYRITLLFFYSTKNKKQNNKNDSTTMYCI